MTLSLSHLWPHYSSTIPSRKEVIYTPLETRFMQLSPRKKTLDFVVWIPEGFTVAAPQDYIYSHILKVDAWGFDFQSVWSWVLNDIPPLETLTGLGIHSTTGNYQEQINLLRQSQRFKRQPRARLNDKIHHLHKATSSRLGEVGVSPNK